MFLDLRYSAEVPATTRWGRAVSCLSGRTAAYRTHLLQSLSSDLLNETFLGKSCISGDDKRYTMLVLLRGFKTWHQLNARVYSTFKPDLLGFTRQRVRWLRNSFRSDCRSLFSRWFWRHPYLAVLSADKNIAMLTQLNGPIIFLLAVCWHQWTFIVALLVWWHCSRAIKISAHLADNPKDLVILPMFLVTTFYMSALKLYAFITMNKQGWLTRPVGMVNGEITRLIPSDRESIESFQATISGNIKI
jgi:hyaluronan synthase